MGGLAAMWTTGLAPEAPAGRAATRSAGLGAAVVFVVVFVVVVGAATCASAHVITKGRRTAGRKT